MVLYFSIEANATEDCPCESYRQFVPVVSATLNVSNSLSKLHPEGQNFNNELTNKNELTLITQAKRIIPKRCWKTLLGEELNKLKIVAQYYMDSRSNIIPITKGQANDVFNVYANMVFNYFVECQSAYIGKGLTDVEATDVCLENQGEIIFNDVDGLIYGDNEEIYNFLEIKGYDDFTQSDIETLRVYHELLEYETKDQALDYLSSVKQDLSTEQKLDLVAAMGDSYLGVYDESKSEARSLPGSGATSFNQCSDALRTYILPFNEHEYCGVCRDHAAYQGQMLNSLGFKNTYVIGFINDDGMRHANVYTQDPDNPYVGYRFDYYRTSDLKNGDTRALFSYIPEGIGSEKRTDVSFYYRIYKPNIETGRAPVVGHIQSDLGKFYAEAAGFNIKDLDPLAQSRSSFLAADYTLGKANNQQVRAGFGTDGIGSRQHIFLAGTTSYGQKTRYPGKVGYVFDYSFPGKNSLGEGDITDSMAMFYTQWEQSFITPYLELNNVRIHAQEKLIAMATLGKMTSGHWEKNGQLISQINGRSNSEIVVNAQSPKRLIKTESKAGLQLVHAIADVRNQDLVQPHYLTLNHLYLSHETAVRLSNKPKGQVHLINRVVLDVSQLGTRGRFEVGVLGNKVGGSYSISGAFPGAALIQDQSVLEHGLTGFIAPKERLKLNAHGFIRHDEVFGGRMNLEAIF